MEIRGKFIEIYNRCIHREGADKLLAYLESPASDFFTAPASARYHGAYAGGLAEHSLNVYECLADYLARERVPENLRPPGSGGKRCHLCPSPRSMQD